MCSRLQYKVNAFLWVSEKVCKRKRERAIRKRLLNRVTNAIVALVLLLVIVAIVVFVCSCYCTISLTTTYAYQH